jgi:iron transport multicopper oxidase
MLHILLFAFLAASLLTEARHAKYNLPIINANIAPDGFTRPVVLAGGTFPGRTIRGDKGDTFVINVIDELYDKSMDVVTSIHWHGIDQPTFNAFDGAAFVNQCPIIPGDVFQYKFRVPYQAGTFWYHSHFANQYCDGLRGALVVHDPQDPHARLYDVDDDSTVITLADWYHYVSHKAPSIPSFDSVLINGAGRYAGGPAAPLAVVNVQQGTRYRFRLVNIACEPNFKFSIDNHSLTIIEVEGTNVKPLVVDQIQIFVGQRYSFVLHANQPVNNYWIRALPNKGNATTNNGINSAILRYAGAHIGDPTSQDTSGKHPLVETNLHPLVPSPVPGLPFPGGADHNIALNVTIGATGFLVNNVSYSDPSVPILLQILSGTKKVQDLVPSGSIYGLKRGEVVQLTIPAGVVGGPHPVHLHGHSFYVVRSAGNSSYNWVDPIIRDVVSIGNKGDNVTIRFVADNPGPWFFHCHIDWHLAAGFAVVFAEDIPDIPSTDVPSDAWFALCPLYNAYINGTWNVGGDEMVIGSA